MLGWGDARDSHTGEIISLNGTWDFMCDTGNMEIIITGRNYIDDVFAAPNVANGSVRLQADVHGDTVPSSYPVFPGRM